MIILNLAYLWNLLPFLEVLEHVECAAFAQVNITTCNMHKSGSTPWIGVIQSCGPTK